ncbi:uncharacterized protein TrAFT101_006403 [Trichoderma asperellum]|uniref:Metallo-beta-lactamase domain-containing protein n=1 Tax=Trichoderma asperellum (strain ATCC 204424 / CBS 433.97 / NBRC 101777) TaxID=1042311 RepID=A0A2T3YRB4_TRIA4|nr:hypothetical protein M441DRAFT_84900 [Trichoderma asperellum CBS 433.97]PTB35064.1 hypothetical protein M441DRAFT_84900 [Trichoderma asperellum CBS 433.97]UKZ91425.1 hypothetical protein TrAFT101_006403 [Trichoderma asperellum]
MAHQALAIEEIPLKKHKGGYMQINKALDLSSFQDYLEAQLSHLPAIADVERISPRVIRVLGQNAGMFTLQGTNTYIVGTGRHRILIDTGQGIPEWAELLSTTLEAENASLSYVLISHWHGDHMGGVPDLCHLYPYLSNSIYKNSPGINQQPIADGQLFSVEGATLRAVHSPGHSHDHMCFVLEEDNAMFTGDNILGHGTAANEHLNTWMESLRVMSMHNCKIGYPAHGMVIDNLPGKIKNELAVKAKREVLALQVLQKIKLRAGKGKGSVTVRELVTEAHGDRLDEAVREMAIQPLMEEVLRKLAEDQKVAFEVRNGEKKWFRIQFD